MKTKLLCLLFTAVLCMPSLAAATVAAEYDFNDGKMPSEITAGNIEGETIELKCGLYGKSSDDYSYVISRNSTGQINPHGKISKSVIAGDNELLHIKASLAIDDFEATSIGIGGKLIYKDETGTQVSGFLARGTPIGIRGGVLSCFGVNVEGVMLRENQWYTVDVLVDTGSSAGNSAKVFVNGNVVAENLPLTTKIGDAASYQLLGMEDVRLNVATSKDAVFSCCYDDILVEIAESEEQAVKAGITAAGTIALGSDGYISKTDIQGMNSEKIINNFVAPEGARLEVVNKLGKKVNNLTKTNYLRLSYEDGTEYLYKIEEAVDKASYNTFYQNDMKQSIAGTQTEGGIGGKETNDLSAYPTGSQVNIYTKTGNLRGEKLIIEMSFCPVKGGGNQLIEAVSDTGIFARFAVFTNEGYIAIGQPQTNIAQYETGKWYKLTAVVSEDLSYDFYIGDEKQDTTGLRFTNAAEDTRKFTALTRIKMSFSETEKFYMDDFKFTIAEQYPYETGELKSWLASDIFRIENGTVYIDSPNITSAQLVDGLDADDEIYVDEKTNDEAVGFEAILSEITDSGIIKHPVLYNIITSGVFLSGGNEIETLAQAQNGKISFEGEIINKSENNADMLLLSAAYQNGLLTDISVSAVAAAAGESKPAVCEIDISKADCAEVWLISDFDTRKPMSKVFQIK